MTHRKLGVVSVVVSAVILFVWIPLDVETGIVEKVRRQTELGDAFAPFIAALLIGLGGVLLLCEKNTPAKKSAATPHSMGETSFSDFTHALVVFVLIGTALLLMRYSGPLAVSFILGSEAEYRLLRDTAPWKYIGFIAGGLWLIVSLIILIENRLRLIHIVIAAVVVLLLIALYDLPFDTLLLPPNGDV